ncbi:MAG: hypothetical protein HZC22_13380 [Rhodocyclales bacterium]|nr:hypothetical protein [Rhodocyclales bacterium]
MSASVIEQVLARVKVVLFNTTSAGRNVWRGRDEAVGDNELPGLNIHRGPGSAEVLGTNGTRMAISFDIEHQVMVAVDWETAVDALHMEVHARLMADAALAALGRGLTCTGTDTQSESADRVAGKLTARYQLQAFIRPGDMTRSIT